MDRYFFFFTLGRGHTDSMLIEAESFQEALELFFEYTPNAQIIDWEQVA